MPALIERPKMTKTMYQALKRHIMREREKKKQEQEQDEAQERLRKEREQRKKKEQEDSMTLEQTKEQIGGLESKLDSLKKEKHELFSQLKKVLHQEDETRRRAQVKEQNELLSMSQHYTQNIPVSSHLVPYHLPTNTMPSRHPMYKPSHQMHQIPSCRNYLVMQGIKRPRSPSPPPATMYQHYQESKYTPATYSQSKAYTPAQKHGHYQTAQASHVTYVTQSQGYHQQQQQVAQQQAAQQQAAQQQAAQQQAAQQQAAQQQAAQQQAAQQQAAQQQAAQQQAAQQQQSQQTQQPQAQQQAAGYQTSQSTASKYPASQSAFTSYPSHYAHQQKQITDPYPAGYAVQRMPAQPGYHPPHGATIPLQQQLEHASQKSGFSEEKYKMQQAPAIRGMAPMPPQQQQLLPQQVQLQQQPQNKGSIVTGYPVRTQAQSSHSSSYQPSQSGYNQQNGAQRRPYHSGSQPPGRYY